MGAAPSPPPSHPAVLVTPSLREWVFYYWTHLEQGHPCPDVRVSAGRSSGWLVLLSRLFVGGFPLENLHPTGELVDTAPSTLRVSKNFSPGTSSVSLSRGVLLIPCLVLWFQRVRENAKPMYLPRFLLRSHHDQVLSWLYTWEPSTFPDGLLDSECSPLFSKVIMCWICMSPPKKDILMSSPPLPQKGDLIWEWGHCRHSYLN